MNKQEYIENFVEKFNKIQFKIEISNEQRGRLKHIEKELNNIKSKIYNETDFIIGLEHEYNKLDIDKIYNFIRKENFKVKLDNISDELNDIIGEI